MILIATLAMLSLWAAFILIFDPDGFHDARKKAARPRSARTHAR